MCEGLRGGEGIFVSDLDDFVDDFHIEVSWNETRTDSLNHVRSWLTAGNNRAVRRLNRKRFHVTTRFQYFRNSRDRATCSDAGDKRIDFAIIDRAGRLAVAVDLDAPDSEED